MVKGRHFQNNMAHFTAAAQGTNGIEDLAVIMVLRSGLKGSLYVASLIQRPMKNLFEAMTRAQEVMQAKNNM